MYEMWRGASQSWCHTQVSGSLSSISKIDNGTQLDTDKGKGKGKSKGMDRDASGEKGKGKGKQPPLLPKERAKAK